MNAIATLGPTPYKASRKCGEFETEQRIQISHLGRVWDVLAVYTDLDGKPDVIATAIKPADALIECAWIPVDPEWLSQQSEEWEPIQQACERDLAERKAARAEFCEPEDSLNWGRAERVAAEERRENHERF